MYLAYLYYIDTVNVHVPITVLQSKFKCWNYINITLKQYLGILI